MEWHPYAKLFPMMSEDKIQELAEDIRKNGLIYPIIVDSDDRIIDGRNRSVACELAGIEQVVEAKVMDDQETLAFVVSANLRRRHLNESQRADIAAKMATLKHGGDRKSKDQAANRPLDSKPVVSQEQAAELMNVSPRSVRRAAKVQREGSDELKAAVSSGDVALSRAEIISELPKAEQAAAIKENPREIKEGPPENNGVSLKPSKAILIAEEAINCLKRIPANDPKRKDAFRVVADFIKRNMRKI